MSSLKYNLSTNMNLSYAANQVKKYDHDRYICCLFAPKNVMEKLFTILNFNAEISSISEQTSELTPALIRITWWQDAIANLYQGKIQSHSLIKALNEIIAEANIPQALFTDLLEARMLELHQEVAYDAIFAKKTGGNLLEIMALSLGIKETLRFKPIGIAWALLGILRSAKYAASLRKILPFALDNKAYVIDICKEIEKYLAMVDINEFNKASAPLDLLFYLAQYYLKLLIKADYDLLSDKLSINPMLKQLYLSYRYFNI